MDNIEVPCPECAFPLLAKVDVDYLPRVVNANCPNCSCHAIIQYQLILIGIHPKLLVSTIGKRSK